MKIRLTVLLVPFVIGVLLTGCGYSHVKSDDKESTVSSNIAVKPDEATKDDSTTDAIVKKKDSSIHTNESSTERSGDNPIKNSSTDSPSPDAGYVTINPKSPYQDYCEVLAKYLNQNFDTKLFKHITIEYLLMYAKQTNPKYAFGEVTLNVEHVKGKVSKYQEGKNKLYIRFEVHHPDGSKNVDTLDFNPLN